MQKNGNTISFDYSVMAEVIQNLQFDQIGQLFDAILEYAQNGTAPNFENDNTLNAIWPLIRPM